MDGIKRRPGRLLLALTVFSFFFLLGSRSLNEPDEGRYAEVAREMLETGDWLVPHIWYVPHLDKPPLTYWAVALSMALFGQNEWAVRLPLALSGLSGIGAVFLLGCALGGRRAGLWSALLLQSSLLYFVMARMLTPDIILSQFILWALYFGWRGWRSLDDLNSVEEERRGRAAKRCFGWQMLGWGGDGPGVLTKGPIAVIIPAAAMTGLIIYRRKETTRWQLLLLGLLAGVMVFGLIVGPWFLRVFQTVPGSFAYMVKGQALGHALGTTIKNRGGSPLYYVAILAVGFLPWTGLLGWLWRRAHWRSLNPQEREGWVWLSAWAGVTFILFSLMRAKLPAYILPMFPALSLLVANRWLAHDRDLTDASTPAWIWRSILLGPSLLLAAIPLAMRMVFKVTEVNWLWPLFGLALLAGGMLAVISRRWGPAQCLRLGVLYALVSLWIITALVPSVETSLKANQTLKPLAMALKAEYRSEAIVVCAGQLPQGLPFYAYPVVSATHYPLLFGLATNQLPFEFPGNRQRLADQILRDEATFQLLLAGKTRVLVVGFQGSYQRALAYPGHPPLRLITQVGRWELFANR